LLGNTTAFADFGYAVYVRAANFPQSQASVEIYYGFPRDPILATPSFTGPGKSIIKYYVDKKGLKENNFDYRAILGSWLHQRGHWKCYIDQYSLLAGSI